MKLTQHILDPNEEPAFTPEELEELNNAQKEMDDMVAKFAELSSPNDDSDEFVDPPSEEPEPNPDASPLRDLSDRQHEK